MTMGHSLFRAMAMKKAAELAERQAAEAKANEDSGNNGPR